MSKARGMSLEARVRRLEAIAFPEMREASAEPDPAAIEPKFKIGDRVRILASARDVCVPSRVVGRTGVICDPGIELDWFVRMDSGDTWDARESDIEPEAKGGDPDTQTLGEPAEDRGNIAAPPRDTDPVGATLRPCPFCGGEPKFFTQAMHRAHMDYSPDACIECASCEAYIVKDTDAEAVAAWNSRVPATTERTDD